MLCCCVAFHSFPPNFPRLRDLCGKSVYTFLSYSKLCMITLHSFVCNLAAPNLCSSWGINWRKTPSHKSRYEHKYHILMTNTYEKFSSDKCYNIMTQWSSNHKYMWTLPCEYVALTNFVTLWALALGGNLHFYCCQIGSGTSKSDFCLLGYQCFPEHTYKERRADCWSKHLS